MSGRLARWVCLTGLALVVLVLPFSGEGRAADRRVALVIGNAAYRSAPALANPIRDAEAIAKMFREAGFDSVDLKLDLDSLEMKRAVRGFLLTAKESDLAVVYFAGHGIEVGGDNYVVPVDARLRTDFDVEDEGIALDRLIRAVEPARRLRLVILDACRDNPFIRTIARTTSTRAITLGLGKVEPMVSDTLIAYAARAGSVADDGQTGHSPFTTALLRHLPTPGLDIRVAFGRVRDDVLRATGGRQEPFVYGSLGGSTISIVPDRAASPPRDPAAEARRDYEFAERVGTREAWTSFLQSHPTGFLADLARAQLTKFPGGPVPSPAARPEVRRPAPAVPAVEPAAALAALPAAGPTMPAAGPVMTRGSACERDRAALARLREEPDAPGIARLAAALACEELRPQLVRLMESIGAAVPPPPARPAEPPRAEPAPTASRINPSAPGGCERDGRILTGLRSDPDLKAVDRFLRALSCPDLRPQVLRLRESLLAD